MNSPHRAWFGRCLLVVVVGGGSGLFGAYCYHGGKLLRPIAHSVGLWVFLAVVCAVRVPARPAIGYAILSLGD